MSQQKSTADYQLTPAQKDYVDFTAVGGLIPSDEGAGKKISAQEFADHWHVDRTTLYLWRKTIPDFWDRVNEARRTIGSRDRLTNVWNAMFLKAAGGNVEAAKVVLANFDDKFVMPSQKMTVEAGDSWGELLASQAAIDEPVQEEVIESAVVEQRSIADQLTEAREKLEHASD